MPNTPTIGLLLALLLAVSCATPPPAPEAEPYTPPPRPEEDSIGYFLANYDKSLRRWNELTLAGGSDRDARTLRALQGSLERRALDRQEELLQELESGPSANREVAAVALGFTGDPAMLSPLLTALSDPSSGVVRNALLGIGILGLPETPVAQILHLLETSPEPWVRNNAAFALQRLVAAGLRDPDVPEACRLALADEEPGVRAQAASVLGMLHDAESVPYLGDLLADDVNLVVQAAATSLARIGRVELERKGEVARLLVDALDRVEGPQRIRLLGELVVLAERNFGEETGPWREWAYRMP